MKFRKKPVVIEAVCWNGATLGITNKPVDLSDPLVPADTHLVMPDWLPKCGETLPTEAATQAAVQPGEIRRFHDILYIGTLEGTMAALPGDWIIRGVKGEIYPCKPDIFAATYEPVEPEAQP